MLSSQNLAGHATFSYDYFLNGGFIGCSCPDCHTELRIPIAIYRSGKLVAQLEELFGKTLLDELIERRIVNLKDETNRLQSHLEKYTLWQVNAQYELVSCTLCNNRFLAIFGMAEIQPGREEVQLEGVWKFDH